MSINYRQCYDLLELDSDASWEELRKNYKHLVQKNHPDRFEQNPEAKENAEVRLRELNHAYKRLVEYYKSHRRLPFGKAPTKNHVNWQFQNTSGLESRDEELEVSSGRTPLTMAISKWLVLGVPITLVVAVFVILVNQFIEGEAEPATIPVAPSKVSNQDNESPIIHKVFATFQYGDPKTRVIEVQGEPDRIVAQSWFYGESRVDFLREHVASWEIHDNSPLRVTGTFPEKEHQFIDVGTSMEDVLSIHGEPIVKTQRRWDYGASFIEFENGMVVSWYSSVLRPLAVRKKSQNRE